MTKARPFPLNAWYAVAWSHEIKQELVPAPFATRTSCCYRTVSAAIQHYVLVANGAGYEFLLDLMAPSYGIPGVQWEWPCLGHGAPPVRFY